MKRTEPRFVVCVNNQGYAASLALRKLYEVVSDEAASKLRQIRVIDESGEDYLYPKACFRTIALPQAVRRAVLAAARACRPGVRVRGPERDRVR